MVLRDRLRQFFTGAFLLIRMQNEFILYQVRKFFLKMIHPLGRTCQTGFGYIVQMPLL